MKIILRRYLTGVAESPWNQWQDVRGIGGKVTVEYATRSDTGRKCRDPFTSLKMTCRKLGLSFWKYLTDRVSLTNSIPPLADILRNHVAAGLP